MAVDPIKRKTINGVPYETALFPGRHGLALAMRLGKFLGPSGGALLEAVGRSGNAQGAFQGLMESELGGKLVGEALKALTEHLDEDSAMRLVLDLLSTTRREGKVLAEAEFDRAYIGNYAEMFQALWFVVESNFVSFTTGGRGETIGAPPVPRPAEANSRAS